MTEIRKLLNLLEIEFNCLTTYSKIKNKRKFGLLMLIYGSEMNQGCFTV